MADQQPSQPRLEKNNFDLLRLALSMIVCLVHAAELSEQPSLSWIPEVLSSGMAVSAFFIVSGFLIFMSYERSTSLRSYASKRVRRLYPAYAVVVLLCAFGLYTVSSAPDTYFGAKWLKYLASNLVFLNFIQLTLPGVFDGNPQPIVNGALWSLKIEVCFYLAVPFIVFAFRYGRTAALLGGYCLSLAWVAVMKHLEATRGPIYAELARQLPGTLSFFLAGGAIYYHLSRFERHIKWLLPTAIAVLVCHRFFLPLDPLYPAALAIVVCFLALFGYAGNFGRYGDFSYGLYILHFPILQLLIAFGAFTSSPFVGLLCGVLMSLLAAYAVWHGVEKRFLARSSHYVVATEAVKK